jgi:hypothetical protein
MELQVTIALLAVAALETLSALCIIAYTGKQRPVITPPVAVLTAAVNAAIITIIVLAAVRIGHL